MSIFDLTVISDPTVIDAGKPLFKCDFAAYSAYDVNLVKSAVLVADHINLRSIREEVGRMTEAEFGRVWRMPMRQYQVFLQYSAFREHPDFDLYPINRSLLAPEGEAHAEIERFRKAIDSESGRALVSDFIDKYNDQMGEMMYHLASFFQAKRRELDTADIELLRGLDCVSIDGWIPGEDDRREQIFNIAFAGPSFDYWTSLGDVFPSLLDSAGSASLMLSGMPRFHSDVQNDIFQAASQPNPASIAVSFVAALPSFKKASLSQVLDLRSDLADFLPGFRGEMIELSDRIESKGMDNMQEIQSELDKAWYQDIQPGLAEIRAIAKRKSYPRALLDEISTDGATQLATGASVILAAGGLVAGLAALLPAAVGVALPFVKSLNQWMKDQDEIKSNKLFLLHEVDRRLS